MPPTSVATAAAADSTQPSARPIRHLAYADAIVWLDEHRALSRTQTAKLCEPPLAMTTETNSHWQHNTVLAAGVGSCASGTLSNRSLRLSLGGIVLMENERRMLQLQAFPKINPYLSVRLIQINVPAVGPVGEFEFVLDP